MPLPRFEAPRLGRRLFTLALCLAACAALGAALPGRLTPSAGAASTFVVNSNADGADANPADNLCADASGNCTLRAAIQQANATAGADTINFQISTGAQTIAPAFALPVVVDSLTIDATTQPGYAGTPLVTLSGANAGSAADGLFINAGTMIVRGLVINGFRSAGVRIGGAGGVLAGNYIGTDAAGVSAVGNGVGVLVSGDGVLVGGASAAERNVISGNVTGVVIFGSTAAVRGNYIGVAADGSTPLPNAGDGVSILSSVNPFGIVISDAHDNSVGGTAAGQSNVIAHNGGNGISVSGHKHGEVFNRANSFRGNSLYSNGLQGISLARPPTVSEANDPSDADEGPNDLQNHPLLTSAAPSGGGANVQGSLDSRPDTTYALDFYANSACDGSGQGEGQAYVGSSSVTTDAAGHAQINASLPSIPASLPVLTATATDPSGNTSEFSPCLNAAAPSTVQFKRAFYEVFETAAPAVVVTVTRTVGASSGAASVDYATSDGTARAGLDYVAAAGTVNFAPGETTRSFAVQLVNDPTDEDTQGFNVTLSNPTGGVALGVNSTTLVRILDDDRMPLAEADSGSTIVEEGDSGTTPAVFKVRLSVASEKPLTVRYSTPNGIAAAPQDFEAATGELTFAPGETLKTVTVNVLGDTEPEPEENFFFRVVAPTDDGRGFTSSASGFIFDDDGAPGVHFASAHYEVAETAGHLDIRVVRRGDTSTAASVEYRMSNVSASVHDYTPVNGRLDFAPGEIEKSFVFLVNDDAFVESPEEVSLLLVGDATGTLGFEVARLNITSDDAQPPTPANNPVDDTSFFVRQHYHDFLAREPDAEGFAFWKGQIDACGASAECRRVMRAGVSAAFFLSIEFQRTGYQVFRVYAATYPERLNSDSNGRVYQLTPLGILFPEMAAIQRGVVVGGPDWEQRLRDNTLDFARRWVERDDFKAYLPADMPAADYVNTLFSNAGVTPTSAERDAAEAAFGAGGTEGRAAALLSATNSRSFYNSQYNAAFVVMQYYGYLRRAPNAAPDSGFAGYDFWLSKLDSFSLPGEDVRDDAVAASRAARAEMARAFVESAEYRARFGMP
ncbi:MAG: Calx-beta domain-containing protein [Pyrinomonadaceae bacterium]